jgi:hypothetical protein
MRKLMMLGLMIIFGCASVAVVQGQGHGPKDDDRGRDRDRRHDQGPPPPHSKGKYDRQEREKARRVLNETHDVLDRAQREAARGGYDEGLGRAFTHQQEAKDYFRRDHYDWAISHSMRARDIAKEIIAINGEKRREPKKELPHRDFSKHDDVDNSIDLKLIGDKAALKIKLKLD